MNGILLLSIQSNAGVYQNRILPGSYVYDMTKYGVPTYLPIAVPNIYIIVVI